MVFQDVEVDNKGRPAHPPPADASASSAGNQAANAEAAGQERLPHGVADRLPGETEEGRKQRLAAAKLEASRRPSYGHGDKGFAQPKDDSDRMRKGAPYKVSCAAFPLSATQPTVETKIQSVLTANSILLCKNSSASRSSRTL